MPNPLCHFELVTGNSDSCKAFYKDVFGWAFDDKSMPGYTLIDTGREPSGAILPSPSNVAGACMNVYFNVDDIENTLDVVKAKGGKVLVPKTEIPGVGYFALFADPDGIPIGITKPAG